MAPDSTVEPGTRRIYDAFMFFNELDALEIRLRELDPVVDWFVIVESSLTFSGKPKDLVFEKNRDRFRDFEAKILYEPLRAGEAGMNIESSPWQREHAQRDHIHRFLSAHGARADDIVMVSDADEIPCAAVVREYRLEHGLRKLDMPLFYYFLNLRVRPTGWQGAFIVPFGQILAPLTSIRAAPATYIEHAGWHFSYLGGVACIQEKIAASAHTELDLPLFRDEAHIARCILERTDLFDRGGDIFDLVPIDAELPAWVVDAQDRLQHLLWKPDRPGAVVTADQCPCAHRDNARARPVQRREIPLFKVGMSPEAADRVAEVLRSGYIGQGVQVDEFEQELAEYLGHPAPLTVNSATSGLTLALRLVCGEGDENREVLSPPITCTATSWAILAAGLRIRWVDTNPCDGNMDVADLRRKISPQTKAIMLVHWGGYPNDLDGVRAVQDECLQRFGHRPAVIEDGAHALGAEYRGGKLGLHGNYTVFSFQAIKPLTTGDGGALLCPDDRQTQRARLMRWYGLDRKVSDCFRCEQDVVEWGYKFHMNDVNAAIGRANLPYLQGTLQRQRENAAYYETALRGIPGLTLLETDPCRRSACWLFTFRVRDRDELQQKLRECGVMCGRVHERNDRYTCTREFHADDLPGTDQMHREMLCIPVGWWLSPEDREYIVDRIREGW